MHASRHKAALMVLLCLIGGLSQAAKYDISAQDLLAPHQGEELYKQGMPFEKETTSFFEPLLESDREELKQNYKSVLELIKQNNFDQAQVRITELLNQFPDEPEFHNLHALLKIQQKDKAAAAASYEEALKLNPNNLTALQGQAIWALENNEPGKALKYINKALAANPKVSIFYILKANIAYQQHNMAEVENILSTAFNNVQGDITQELQVAGSLVKLHMLSQQPEKMLELAQALEKRYPTDTHVLSLLAKAQLVNKHLDEGEQTLKKIIAKDKDDVSHRLFLAQLMMNRPERSKEAAQLVNEALLADPKNLKSLTLRTILLIQGKKFDQAMDQADWLEKSFPESAAGNLLKADISLVQRQLDKALAYNQKAYKIEPSPKLLNKIVLLLSKQGAVSEAIQLLSNELDKTPNDLKMHFQIANLYLNQKNYAKAEEHYLILLKESPRDPVILNNLAMLYYQQNSPKALELAKQAYTISPDSAAIADTYGVVLFRQERYREALETLQKAVELAPDAKDIQFHLAKAQQANGNKQAAIVILEKIVNSPIDFENKHAAEDLLKELKNN